MKIGQKDESLIQNKTKKRRREIEFAIITITEKKSMLISWLLEFYY